MSMQRKLSELLDECARLGVQPLAGGRGGKPGKWECTKALADYFIGEYEAQGLLHPCQRWIHENIQSPKLATSATQCKEEDMEQFWNDPNVGVQTKWDGCRCLVAFEPGKGFGFYSRNRSVTEGNPDQVPFFFGDYTNQIWGFQDGAFKDAFKKSFILDAEITCDSKELMHEMGAETQLAAMVAVLALNRPDSWKKQEQYADAINFNVFDCIMVDGKSTMALSYEKRDLLAQKICSRMAELAAE